MTEPGGKRGQAGPPADQPIELGGFGHPKRNEEGTGDAPVRGGRSHGRSGALGRLLDWRDAVLGGAAEDIDDLGSLRVSRADIVRRWIPTGAAAIAGIAAEHELGIVGKLARTFDRGHATFQYPEFVSVVRPEDLPGARKIRDFHHTVFFPYNEDRTQTPDLRHEVNPQGDRSKVEVFTLPNGKEIFLLDLDPEMLTKYHPSVLSIYYLNSGNQTEGGKPEPQKSREVYLDMNTVRDLLNADRNTTGRKEDNRLTLILADEPLSEHTGYGNVIEVLDPIARGEGRDVRMIYVNYFQDRGLEYIDGRYATQGRYSTYEQVFSSVPIEFVE